MHANARNSPKASGTSKHAQSHTNTRGGGGPMTPTRCSKMTIRTTRQRLKLCETGRRHRSRKNASAPCRSRNCTTKAEIRKHDTEWRPNELGKPYLPRHPSSTPNAPANRSRWGNTPTSYRALPPSDPRHHRRRNANAGIIDKHGDPALPSGEQNTPSEALATHGETRQKTTLNWRHGASPLSTLASQHNHG
jgi:hypothetical protein